MRLTSITPIRKRRQMRATICALVAVTLLASSCGSGAEEFVQTELDERFSIENVEQLVAFSDYVVIFTVNEELRLPPEVIPEAPRSYEIGRDVVVNVDRVLWSSAAAPKIGESLTFRTFGWWVKDGKGPGVRLRGDAEAILVGETYVAGFVGDGSVATPQTLGLTSSGGVYVVKDDRVVTGSNSDLARIDTLDLDELVLELERVADRPEIEAFDRLDLDERAVQEPPKSN